MTFDFESRWGLQHGCTLSVDRYANNNHIAITAWCDDGPNVVTVNIPQTSKWPENYGYVDVHNFPDAERLIAKLGIGKRIENEIGIAGMNAYPLYRFYITKIRKYK